MSKKNKTGRPSKYTDKKWLIEGASVEVEVRTDLDSSLSSHAAHVEEWMQEIVDSYPATDPRIQVITKENKE
jgi:hypothetical protein